MCDFYRKQAWERWTKRSENGLDLDECEVLLNRPRSMVHAPCSQESRSDLLGYGFIMRQIFPIPAVYCKFYRHLVSIYCSYKAHGCTVYTRKTDLQYHLVFKWALDSYFVVEHIKGNWSNYLIGKQAKF